MGTEKLTSMAADFIRPALARETVSPTRMSNGPSGVGGTGTGEEKSGESVGKQEVSSAVTSINEYFQKTNRTLQFSMNEKLGRVVIEVKDAATDEVIRTIPPKTLIKLAENMAEMSGFLMQERA